MTHDVKLGELVANPDAARDALHFAIAPVVAAQRLMPGWHVGLLPDGRAGVSDVDVLIGIVDPFLKNNVERGQTFWLMLYQNTITSLRHAWTHPAFEGEGVGNEAPVSPAAAIDSQEWIKNFANRISQTVPDLMQAAHDWADGRDYTYDNTESYKDHWDEFPEFWRHWAAVTGRPQPDDASSFFTCSC